MQQNKENNSPIIIACKVRGGWGQKEKDVDRFDVDVFVMGHDWEGEFDFLKDKCEVIYLNRTEGISTTKIKQELYGKDTK